MSVHDTTIPTVEVGDKIRFTPQSGNRWWTVGACDERYIVAWQVPPFMPSDVLAYAVLDRECPYHYNGAGPGVVRSSLNTLGGGWDIDPADPAAGCRAALDGLRSGKWQLSRRRLLDVEAVTVR